MRRADDAAETPASGDDPTPGLSPEVRALVGASRTWRCLVTERDIYRFAQAIGELGPLAFDEAVPSRPLLAPPLFYQTMTYEELPLEALPPDGSPIELAVPVPAHRAMGGMSDYTVHRLARAGETVTVVSTLKDVKRKQGGQGPLYLLVVETRFLDESGVPLATEVATYVKRA